MAGISSVSLKTGITADWRLGSSPVTSTCTSALPPPVLYDIYHFISDGSCHGRPERFNDRRGTESGRLHLSPDRRIGGTGSDGDAGHQYPVAIFAADGGVTNGLDRRGHLGNHGLPGDVRARPARRRADIGSLWKA